MADVYSRFFSDLVDGQINVAGIVEEFECGFFDYFYIFFSCSAGFGYLGSPVMV